ncbi:MAG: DMT family transporter [Acidobacteriota bacterium]
MQTSGNWRRGLGYSLLTAGLWGVLPLVLKALLVHLDPYTLTWLRFLFSAVVLGGFLVWRGRLPSLRSTPVQARWLLAGASVGLVANYVLYLLGLDWTNPDTAQVLIQTAPLFLLLGGIAVFKEAFRSLQWWGLLTFVAGLLLFFHNRLLQFSRVDFGYYAGIGVLLLAALAWAAYGLAQKRLLRWWRSEQILFCIYVAAVILLGPWIHLSELAGLDRWMWLLLLFAALNTLIAYGAFAEALVHWEASRVSAALAVTPLLTILSVRLVEHWKPGAFPLEPIDGWSLAGAAAVVVGSAVTALARPRLRVPAAPPPE